MGFRQDYTVPGLEEFKGKNSKKTRLNANTRIL